MMGSLKGKGNQYILVKILHCKHASFSKHLLTSPYSVGTWLQTADLRHGRQVQDK